MPRESSSDVVKKREALEELLRCEGWAYFCAYVLREWQGVGYQSRMGTALSQSDPVEPKAVHKTALEMVRLLEWPVNIVRDLKGSLDNE
jgi:hypothetical protein